MSYEIIHHGATSGVTGSCHELRWSVADKAHGLLIDCGLFQGAETSTDGSQVDRLQIDFAIDHIDALIITHVHIDHVGRVPYLLAAGFKGPIYCSEASAELLPLVLEDALKIGFTRNERLISQFLQQIQSQIIPIDYGNWQALKNQACIRLQPAGHILGSAFVEIDLFKQHRIIFSGDLGAPYTPLLPSPRSPWLCDDLVIESTYGDKLHENRKNRSRRLQSVIENAVADRGVVLVPAFSIGRTQELLYELEAIIHRQADKKLWQQIEVIVDSPLAADFTAAYRRLAELWDKEAKRRKHSGRHPLSFENLLTIDDHQTHLQNVDYLAKTARPTIVIAASGMCSGGRIVNYLKALIEDKRTNILFVGYQARGTAGSVIQKYGPRQGYVDLDGHRYWIKAGIETITGYSAHADQQNLLNFVLRMRHKPRKIRLVHGDGEAKQTLQGLFQRAIPGADVVIG